MLPYQSIGGLPVGTPVTTQPAGWPSGLCSDIGGGDMYCSWGESSGQIWVQEHGDTVVAWDLSTNLTAPATSPLAGWALPTGIHLGSTPAAVKAAYPGALTASTSGGEDAAVIPRPGATNDQLGMTIMWPPGGVVNQIYARAAAG